jgi:hypothetical protein
MKSGKELTYLEIIKRLNLMGVNYDSSIIGKKYYIDLYNKEIQSLDNQQKIIDELEKDRKYLEYLTNNLRMVKETSFKYSSNINKNRINSTFSNSNSVQNPNDKFFFSDFNYKLCLNILLSYNSFHFWEQNKKSINKHLSLPINAFKSFSDAYIIPNANGLIKVLVNLLEKIDVNLSTYQYLKMIIIICLSIILILFLIKCRKRKNKCKSKRKSIFH